MVLAQGVTPGPDTVKRLQDHVKAAIAPYKYPRSVVFTEALPKTATGKIQRFALRTDGSNPTTNPKPGPGSRGEMR